MRIAYKRGYYKIYNVRLAVDRYIEYIKLNSQGKGVYKTYDPDIIVEIKAEDFVLIEYFFNEC